MRAGRPSRSRSAECRMTRRSVPTGVRHSVISRRPSQRVSTSTPSSTTSKMRPSRAGVPTPRSRSTSRRLLEAHRAGMVPVRWRAVYHKERRGIQGRRSGGWPARMAVRRSRLFMALPAAHGRAFSADGSPARARGRLRQRCRRRRRPRRTARRRLSSGARSGRPPRRCRPTCRQPESCAPPPPCRK